MLVDRAGSRRIAITGVATYCGALALVATVSGSIVQWWLMWLLVGLGSVFIKPTVWMAAIAGRFSGRRGIAMALALCGTSIASATMPLLTDALLRAGGWRLAYAGLAGGAALIVLPLLFLFFRDPPGRASSKADRASLPGLAVRPAMLSSRYIRMAAACLLAMTAIIALTVHYVPILVSEGFARREAAAIAGVIGVASIIGRIATGFLHDRLPGTLVGAISIGLPMIACAGLLAFQGDGAAAVGVAAFIGFALGAETDVVAYLSARYFGLRNYGVLFGTLAGLLSLGAGLGPAIGGLVFDRSGSYDPLIWGLVPAFAAAALLIGSLGRYPDLSGSTRKSTLVPAAGASGQ
jgi:predicted MFS family arabinose efflux permease